VSVSRDFLCPPTGILSCPLTTGRQLVAQQGCGEGCHQRRVCGHLGQRRQGGLPGVSSHCGWVRFWMTESAISAKGVNAS